MGIFSRLAQLVSSNVHAALDRADDPARSVDLLAHELAEQVRRARGEVVAAAAEEKRMAARVAELDREAEVWTSRAELALRADDEALAREALVQKKRVVGERDGAEARRAEQRGVVAQMKAELARMEARSRDLEARKATLAAAEARARSGGGESLGARGGNDALARLRGLEARVQGHDDRVAAAREVDAALAGPGGNRPTAAELEARFAALEARAAASPAAARPADPIDDELAALRRKVRAP